MNLERFIASDVGDAVRQIRARLGAEAVVVSVKPVTPQGLNRLWAKPKLEVLAGVPVAPQTVSLGTTSSGTLLDTTDEPLSGDASAAVPAFTLKTAAAELGLPSTAISSEVAGRAAQGSRWRCAAVLDQMGLLPLNVEKVLSRLRTTHGDFPPQAFGEELRLMKASLASFWRPNRSAGNGVRPVHVFIGPPGAGKTTVLCKWLAKSTLGRGIQARAWRLDGRSANFPGLLDFYSEILGVTVQREWKNGQGTNGWEEAFVDLPGAHFNDNQAMKNLGTTVSGIPGAQVHLVLNAAYDPGLLLAQARGFAALPVSDVIFTHLDEEKRLGKLWNFVLGTNFDIACLSGGQNVPGEFHIASPEMLFSCGSSQ